MRLHRQLFVGALAAAISAAPMVAQDTRGQAAAVVAFDPEELENLVASIALYPDAILAQVLIAATFPDQIQAAAQYVRRNGTRGVEDQAWDISVRAVAQYPPVLNMLAERDDWTVALGQAYALQSSEVMDAVQRLRRMARAQGNLESSPQQTVVVEREVVRIEPAQPRVIYVPTYDPMVVYYRPIRYTPSFSMWWSFGVGFPIGAWLSYDVDWYGRHVYYDGWHARSGWRVVAYPYVVISPVWVHPRYQTVYVNRTVVHRTVNYVNLGRYNTVHRNVRWEDRRRGVGSPGPVPRQPVRTQPGRDRDDDRNRGRVDDRNRGRDDDRGQGRTDPRGGQREPERRVTRTTPDDPKPAIARPASPPPRVGSPVSRAPERESRIQAPAARTAPPPARTAQPPARTAQPPVRTSPPPRAEVQRVPAPSATLPAQRAQRSVGMQKNAPSRTPPSSAVRSAPTVTRSAPPASKSVASGSSQSRGKSSSRGN